MSELERVKSCLLRVVLTPTEAQQLHAIIEARTLPDEPMTERPTIREAVDAVTAASWEVVDPGSHFHGQRIVHVLNNGHGADWVLDEVTRTIRVAGRSRLVWNTRMDRHRLTIDRGQLGTIHVDTTNTGARTR